MSEKYVPPLAEADAPSPAVVEAIIAVVDKVYECMMLMAEEEPKWKYERFQAMRELIVDRALELDMDPTTALIMFDTMNGKTIVAAYTESLPPTEGDIS